MIAVIYDPATGAISSTIQAAEEAVATHGSYLEVAEWRMDYDAKFMVKDGKLVEKTAGDSPTV